MSLPEPLARLVHELGRLPGVGPKSAQRMAFFLLQQDPTVVEGFAAALVEARRSLFPCPVCFHVTDRAPCAICRDPERDRRLLLVVEESKDVFALERTREYRGLYHVLGGSLAPMRGVGPELLHVEELLARLEKEPRVEEVILATDPDVEGDTTALYLARLLAGRPLKVTRIARGLPIGGDIDYADDITLVRSLEGRREFTA
jgi:recombination protein RecR